MRWPKRTAMRSEAPTTPDFTEALAARLVSEANGRKRTRRPFATASLGRLRSVSSSAAHVGLAMVLSATFLLISPASLERQLDLPPVSAAPTAGYLVQYGAIEPEPPSPSATITLARESGFEVDVRRTWVADRASDGEILEMRHLGQTVTTVPTDEPGRGPLFIVIGLAIGDADNTAD